MNKENLQKISDILHELDQRAAFALQEQKYDEALMIYEEVLKAQENLRLEKLSGHTMLNIANIRMMKGEYEKALEYIERASGLKSLQKDHKDSGNIQIFRANCFFMLNRMEEAEKALTQEIRRNKNNTACGKMELLLYTIYMQTDKKGKARIAVDKAISHFKLDDNKAELKRALSCRVEYFRSVGQKMYAELDLAEIDKL